MAREFPNGACSTNCYMLLYLCTGCPAWQPRPSCTAVLRDRCVCVTCVVGRAVCLGCIKVNVYVYVMLATEIDRHCINLQWTGRGPQSVTRSVLALTIGRKYCLRKAGEHTWRKWSAWDEHASEQHSTTWPDWPDLQLLTWPTYISLSTYNQSLYFIQFGSHKENEKDEKQLSKNTADRWFFKIICQYCNVVTMGWKLFNFFEICIYNILRLGCTIHT